MSERPAIPEELRRSVLVEAGHRCAIQTCLHAADIDVHHIVPWAASKEHVFDNLIALCPNCHRRADAAEIDRKSLRLYKTRLAAAFGMLSSQIPTSHDERLWEAGSITETGDSPNLPFELHVEWPIFRLGGCEPINSIESGLALYEVAQFRGEVLGNSLVAGMPGSRLTGAFSVIYIDDEVISLRFSLSEYVNGHAHGGQRTVTRTYARTPQSLLRLEHLLADANAALEAIASYCQVDLDRQLNHTVELDWIERGTRPILANYSKWNLTSVGLLVTFDEYSVAPFSAGRQQVLIPYDVMASWATPLFRRIAKAGHLGMPII